MKLEAAECDISDEDMIMTIIHGIKQAYETFIQCLTVNQKSNQLDLDTIENALILEEKRRCNSKNDRDNKEDKVYYNKEVSKVKIKCFSCNK